MSLFRVRLPIPRVNVVKRRQVVPRVKVPTVPKRRPTTTGKPKR